MLKKRKIVTKISLSTPNGEFGKDSDKGKVVVLEGYRATAEITDISWYFGGTLTMHIYGIPPEVMNKLSTLGIRADLVIKNSIALYVGDEDSFGNNERLDELYVGTIRTAYADYSAQPNVSLIIEAAAGFHEGLVRIPPTTYRGDMDVAEKIKSLTEGMGWTFINDGVTTVLRDVTVNGSAIEQIQELAKASGVLCIMRNDSVTISPYNGLTTATPVKVSPATGMIGYPSFAANGLAVQTIFNPAIKAAGKVDIESCVPQAKGEYNVHTVQHRISCEMPDGDWSTHFYANKETMYLNGRYD